MQKKPVIDGSLIPIMKKIRAKLEARTPFLWLMTDEEQRIQGQIMQKIGLATGKEIIVWSCSQGLLRYDGSAIDAGCRGLAQVLDFVLKYRTPPEYTSTIFILRDPHIHINPQVARLIRDLYTPLTMGQLSEIKVRDKTSSIIFLSGRVAHVANGIVDGLEPSLNDIIDIIDIPLPTKQDLLTYVELGLNVAKKKYSNNNKCTYKLDYSSTDLNNFATSLQGLTTVEALRAISESFPLNHKISVDSLQEKKKQTVRRGGLLEVVDNLPAISQVGGLDEVKKFITLYNGQFTEEAEKFGLEPLKAILFVGVPGCLRGDTKIFDPVDNTLKTIKERWKDNREFYVYSLNDDGKKIIARAHSPHQYPVAPMIEFTTLTGEKFAFTPKHRMKSHQRWIYASEVHEWLQECTAIPLLSSSDTGQESVLITKAKIVDPELYYDFHVPIYENYEACGLWHHNSGKSLCSKALAALWKLPCLRLDMGKVFGGIVGQSEGNMRQVIKVAESSAPCVLLLDEIEKQLSGTASSGSSDGGTTARVFGTLLTAMEEGLKGVCISATANSVVALPPELIRRFDEVFYVDLPVKQERETIFNIHVHKRGRKIEDFDIGRLVDLTYGFTGSEIEKSIKVGLAMAWRDKEELSTEHIVAAIGEMRPLSKIMADKIEESRKWAKGRARRASSLTETGEKKDTGFVDLSSGLDLSELTGSSIREEEKN